MDIANITNLLSSRIRRLERRLTNFQNTVSVPEQEEKKKEYVWRSFNGTGNNLFNPSWGSSNTILLTYKSVQRDLFSFLTDNLISVIIL